MEDIADYIQNKHLLKAAEKEGVLLQTRPSNKGVGLQNSGATCYLNSVIQCLNQIPLFVEAIKNAEKQDEPIVKELKRLLTFLRYSSRHSVKTADLQAAFGWTGNQKLEQHDAHEFYGALVNALLQADPSLQTILERTFQGRSVDTTKCSSCGHSIDSSGGFSSLSVDVPDDRETGEQTYISLITLLKNLRESETLDEDNRWQCGACQDKVCATRTLRFEKLPEVLAVHLKRFRFDPLSKRRRKVGVSVDIPQILSVKEVFGADCAGGDQYYLSGIIVHYGSASGGHYKAYVRSAEKQKEEEWCDCDDAVVDKLNPEVIQELLSASSGTSNLEGENGEEVGGEDDVVRRRQNRLAENAYLLFYSSSSPPATELSISEEVQNDNILFERQLALFRTRRLTVSWKVMVRSVSNPSTILHTLDEVVLSRSVTIAEATSVLYRLLVQEKVLDGTTYALDQVRLCRASTLGRSQRALALETYGDRASISLESVGLAESGVSMFLEVRETADAPFEEVHGQDLRLLLRKWDASRPDGGFSVLPGSDQENKEAAWAWQEIIVPGQAKATVRALRAAAARLFQTEPSELGLIACEASGPLHWLEDSEDNEERELSKHYNIYPGHHIVVELAAATATSSIAFQHLHKLKNQVVLFFNDPRIGSKYNHELICVKEQSLREVRELIARSLGLDQTQMLFHLRRGEGQPQYKEEEKSLEQLGITDRSLVHVQLGKGCNIGEHLLRFEVESMGNAEECEDEMGTEEEKGGKRSRYILLDDIAISEKATVLAVKKLLFEAWPTICETVREAKANVPESLHHIRLRDLKGGKPSGPLRDERIVGRCLLGLADSRRVLVQILPVAEKIGPDDLMVTLRIASFDKRKLSPPIDLCLVRAMTIRDLYAKIVADHGQSLVEPVNEDNENIATASNDLISEASLIELAKGFATGPPLSLKSALKLKWNDSTVLASPQATIDQSPLCLRDGSLLVVRGRADWLRAQQRNKAKKDAELTSQPIAAGTGTSAVRARAQKIEKKLSTSSTEPVLKIMIDGEVRPPQPEQGNPDGNDIDKNGQDALPQSPSH